MGSFLTKVIIAAYVDDLLFITKDQVIIDKIKKALDKRFNFKHLGTLIDYLSIQINRNWNERSI